MLLPALKSGRMNALRRAWVTIELGLDTDDDA